MLRSTGEKINRIVYHMALYNAFNDDLRVIYSKIIRKMGLLCLRNEDGYKLLITRDYELIKLCMDKFITKLSPIKFFNMDIDPISHSYRQYNPAYFEEVILKLKVDERVAFNYRERFLIDRKSIY